MNYNKRLYFKAILIVQCLVVAQLSAQTYNFNGGTCYGGISDDGLNDNAKRGSVVAPSSDGGYLMASDTYSNQNGDVGFNHGAVDIWLCKINNAGAILWQKCIGGTNNEYVEDIKATADGGYILVGYATSTNSGDVGLNHGANDAWVVKLDGTGNITWSKLLGGTINDYGYAIEITSDGGYIIAGTTYSNNGDVSGNHSTGGASDAWVVKLTSTGTISWQKCFGGTSGEWAWSIRQTSDGNYIFTGGASSNNNGDVSGLHGANDIWVVKINTTGTILWQKCLGGTLSEDATCIQQTSDGGYILCGTTYSTNGDITSYHGNREAWVVKLTSTGTITWQRCYGGSLDEFLWYIEPTPDGGYFVTGRTNSLNGDVVGLISQNDIWALQLASDGAITWQRCMGGNFSDVSTFALRTSAPGYIIPGITTSSNGDVTGNHGSNDVWLARLTVVITPPEMVPVQGGTFTMGCTSEQMPDCSSNENPAHEVTLSDFEIGKYEVTQGQWMALMSDVNPSGTPYFPNCGSNCPIERVSWYDAAVFCNRLSQSAGYTPCYYSDAGYTQVYGKSGSVWSLPNTGTIYWNQDANGYRLPTEAEWEYAARGGSQSNVYKYAGTSNLDSLKYYCNYYNGGDGYDNLSSPVGSFLPNELTLFDMSGNVFEWCYDWYGSSYYTNSPSCVPVGESSGSGRVFRGGSWSTVAVGARVAFRSSDYPAGRYIYIGFRLSRTP